MEIQLFDKNLTTPVFVENITTKVQLLRFSTKLSGGFNNCSFRMLADLPEAWDWLTNKVFYRLKITDKKKTLFEGRIEDLELTQGSAGATAYGYYANLSDVPYATAFNAVASVVIKAVLTANCAQISADQTNIDATDITITSAADASYLDIYPQQLFEKLLAFSDSTKGKWYFAIWEDRIPYLKKRSVSSVDWTVNLRDLAKLRLSHRGGDLWNSCYACYQAGGSLTRTATVNDTTSQSKYSLTRRYIVPDVGTVAAAAAQANRDGWMEDHKDIWPKLEEIVLGDRVFDGNGVQHPSSWVRAGEVLRIRDLVPASADAGTVTRDALRTFYIIETEYDVNTGTNRIIVDTESSNLDAILARKL